ncbi:MAG: Two-component system regulatory protein [Actinomycetia bacterium]|jgi:PleD family two-component response regulator|nr:Two-component system regulatory protein [Actinomycetes bacterium]
MTYAEQSVAPELLERDYDGSTRSLAESAREDARVLIVDDDPDALRIMGRVLERGGFWRVESATGGRQALATMRTYEPDVLVVDVNMPEVDGLSMLRALAAETRPRNVTSVLAISGDATPEVRRSMLLHGADDFIVRPCSNECLVARVRELALHAQSLNRALSRLSLLDGLVRVPLDRRRDCEPARMRAHQIATGSLDSPFVGGPRRGRVR